MKYLIQSMVIPLVFSTNVVAQTPAAPPGDITLDPVRGSSTFARTQREVIPRESTVPNKILSNEELEYYSISLLINAIRSVEAGGDDFQVLKNMLANEAVMDILTELKTQRSTHALVSKQAMCEDWKRVDESSKSQDSSLTVENARSKSVSALSVRDETENVNIASSQDTDARALDQIFNQLSPEDRISLTEKLNEIRTRLTIGTNTTFADLSVARGDGVAYFNSNCR